MFHVSPTYKPNNSNQNQNLKPKNLSLKSSDSTNLKAQLTEMSNLMNFLRIIEENNDMNLYEFMELERKKFEQQQKAYRQKMLEKNYPIKFVIGYSIFLGAICAPLIVLQILLAKSDLYYTGFWISAYFIILIFLLLVISKYKFTLFICILLKQSIF